jgi:hypothetical protein
MAGTKPLVCREFVEGEYFARTRAKLMQETGMTVEDVDRRIEAVVWALARGDTEDDAAFVQRVPGRSIWAAELSRGIPPLRLYLRPCSEQYKCEWLWIEEDL